MTLKDIEAVIKILVPRKTSKKISKDIW